MTRPRAPRQGNSNPRRSALVDAGLSLIREVALEEVDAVAVAERAGVSKALVYYYFPTHRDLQVAVVRTAADGLLEAVRTDPSQAPAEQLAAALDAGIAFIEQYPQAYRALSRGAAFSPQLLEVFEFARDGVVATLAAGLGIGHPNPAERICLRGWLALVEEAVLHWIVSGAPVPRAELVAFCRDVGLSILASPLARSATGAAAAAS